MVHHRRGSGQCAYPSDLDSPGAASDAALLELLCKVGSDSGELHAAVARALQDERFSVAELQCVRTEALDLVSAVLAFVQRLEGLVYE